MQQAVQQVGGLLLGRAPFVFRRRLGSCAPFMHGAPSGIAAQFVEGAHVVGCLGELTRLTLQGAQREVADCRQFCIFLPHLARGRPPENRCTGWYY